MLSSASTIRVTVLIELLSFMMLGVSSHKIKIESTISGEFLVTIGAISAGC